MASSNPPPRPVEDSNGRIVIPFDALPGLKDDYFTYPSREAYMTLEQSGTWLAAIDDRQHGSDGKLMYIPYSSHLGQDEDIRRMDLLVSWRNMIQEVGERVLRTMILNKMHLMGLSVRNQSTQPNLKTQFSRIISDLTDDFIQDRYSVIEKLYESVLLVIKGDEWVTAAESELMKLYLYATWTLGSHNNNKSHHTIENILRQHPVRKVRDHVQKLMDKHFKVSFRTKQDPKDTTAVSWEHHTLPTKLQFSNRSRPSVLLRYSADMPGASITSKYHRALKEVGFFASKLNLSVCQVATDCQHVFLGLEPSSHGPVSTTSNPSQEHHGNQRHIEVPSLPSILPVVSTETENSTPRAEAEQCDEPTATGQQQQRDDVQAPVSNTNPSQERRDELAASVSTDDVPAAAASTANPSQEQRDELPASVSTTYPSDTRRDKCSGTKLIPVTTSTCPMFCCNYNIGGKYCTVAVCLECWTTEYSHDSEGDGGRSGRSRRDNAGTNRRKRNATEISLSVGKPVVDNGVCHLDHSASCTFKKGDTSYIVDPGNPKPSWALKIADRELPTKCRKCDGLFVSNSYYKSNRK
ncbi:hypothetical protein ACHAWC_010217 [Mediolabrus comicus]